MPLREEQFLRIDGSTMDVEVASTPLVYANKPAVQIVFRDITESKKQRQALELSQFRLSEAQRIAHLGNWQWEIATGQLWWSDEVYRMFGVDDAVPMTYPMFLQHLHPDDRDVVDRAVQHALYDRQDYELDYRVMYDAGQERIIHAQGEVVRGATGKPLRMLGTVQDVTEQKKAERMILESQRALRSLTAQLQLAEERERRQIAQDLHDSIGQILAFSGRELKMLQDASRPDDGAGQSGAILLAQLDHCRSTGKDPEFRSQSEPSV